MHKRKKRTSPVFGFQHMIRLSLPLLRSSSGSAWLHEMDKIPLEHWKNVTRVQEHQSSFCAIWQGLSESLPGVILQDFERWGCKPEIPHLYDRKSVVLWRQNQLSGHIWMPQHPRAVHLTYITQQVQNVSFMSTASLSKENQRLRGRGCSYSVAVVTDFDDGLVLPQIPDDGFPAGVCGCQYVLHLTVPRHHAHVLRRLTHAQTHGQNRHNTCDSTRNTHRFINDYKTVQNPENKRLQNCF